MKAGAGDDVEACSGWDFAPMLGLECWPIPNFFEDGGVAVVAEVLAIVCADLAGGEAEHAAALREASPSSSICCSFTWMLSWAAIEDNSNQIPSGKDSFSAVRYFFMKSDAFEGLQRRSCRS